MPKWVVICPNCKRQHTYSQVDEAVLESVRRNPLGTHTRPPVPPSGDKQKCSHCMREFKVSNCDLTYSYL
jgi:hypothetical protein